MISSLTFKQENTITDEPVVDLLMFLNKKLDSAVANARLSSGQNSLQQLVLIIGDGRLHEKVPLYFTERKNKKRGSLVIFFVQSMLIKMLCLFTCVYSLCMQENLKRCVRDVLSSKRMVAFLILDSMQESIMDLQVR